MCTVLPRAVAKDRYYLALDKLALRSEVLGAHSRVTVSEHKVKFTRLQKIGMMAQSWQPIMPGWVLL
jgi:hypothetical protein